VPSRFRVSGPGSDAVESVEGQTVVVRVPSILRTPARQLGLHDPRVRARAALAFADMEMVLDQLTPTGNPVKGTCVSQVRIPEEIAALWRYEDAQLLPPALAQLPPAERAAAVDGRSAGHLRAPPGRAGV
jgi:hypothetical protein